MRPTPLALPPHIWKHPPADVVLVGAGKALPVYYSRDWGGALDHSYGRPYLCPLSCSLPRTRDGANSTHMLGLPWGHAFAQRLQCPFW